MKRTTKILIWIALLLTFALLGLTIYWLTWPYKVFQFYTPVNKILTPQVKAGEHVAWQTDVNQLTDGVQIEVQKQLQDGVLISYPPSSYISKKGRMTFTNATSIIPKYVPAGKYKMIIYNYVKINPIRTILITRETEEFEVIK